MPRSCVLDSSALLAALFEEPGGEITVSVLGSAVMSALNYSEVITKLVRVGERHKAALEVVDDLNLPIIAWDLDLAREASDLCELAWTHGLSIGDRACLATARHLKRTVLTAERGWRKLPDLGIDINFIR